MTEIILPPEENEETPQVPELNIDKPTENSKVITIEFEAKKTNKVSTKDTNQQLYTTDTDAWFEFKETSLEGANGTYSVVFRNRHDGSIFQRTGDVVGGVAYYKIPHQEIRHAGAWRGQVVYTLSNGDTTAREFDYDVKGHILDGKDVQEIVVEDFETLMSQLRSMKDNAEVELADLVSTTQQNETDRQAFFDDLIEDIDGLQANYQELLDTGVLQTNINTKLETLEEEYAPKLTEVTAQLQQTEQELSSQLADKRDKSVKIKGTELETATDIDKVHLVNLSEEVQAAMAGTAPVISSVADGSLTTAKYADGSVGRVKVSPDVNINGVFDPTCNFLRDRGDGIFVSIHDTVIKHIYDLRLYNVTPADKIYLWRIWKNGDYFSMDFKDANGNMVCRVAELIANLNFVDNKPTRLEIKPYNVYKFSGFVSLNLNQITSVIRLTNLTMAATLLSQQCYEYIDNRYTLYPFANYTNNEPIRLAVRDIKVYGDKTHVYALESLRIDDGGTYAYIVEIKDVTANKIVSRIQSTGQFAAGVHTIALPEYQSSGVVSYITINGGGSGFSYYGLGFELAQECVYDRAYDIVFPDTIPCVVGKELNIYSENLLSNSFNSQTPLILQGSDGVHNLGKFTFQPVTVGTSTLYGALRDKGIDTLVKRTNIVTVATTAGNGLTKKVMVIGDSKTDNATKLAELVNLFDGDAMAIDLVGTISKNGTDADGATRAIKSEGRSSWGVDDYYNKATFNTLTNPFYNATSGFFDFTYYMTQNGFTGVDYVFIDFGANDTGLAISDIKTYYDHIIASIKAYDSNIKIIISLQEGHCLREATVAAYQQNKIILNKIVTNLIKWYGGQEGNNIYLCPQYISVDLYNDFPTSDVPLSNRNPKIVTKCTDYTHPSAYGYYKIADMYYFMIKYLASIGA